MHRITSKFHCHNIAYIWVHNGIAGRAEQSYAIRKMYPLQEDRLEASSQIAVLLKREKAYVACKMRLAKLENRKASEKYHTEQFKFYMEWERITPLLFNGTADVTSIGFLKGIEQVRDGKCYMATMTQLSKYVLAKFNFRKLLENFVLNAKNEGSIFRVLDIGVGKGAQWLNFIKIHRKHFEFSGTALLDCGLVDPRMAARVKFCSSDELVQNFEPASFNLIVSHFGMAYQFKEALESSIVLGKAGCDMFFTGDITNIAAYYRAVENKDARYEVLESIPPNKDFEWFLHIRKK